MWNQLQNHVKGVQGSCGADLAVWLGVLGSGDEEKSCTKEEVAVCTEEGAVGIRMSEERWACVRARRNIKKMARIICKEHKRAAVGRRVSPI